MIVRVDQQCLRGGTRDGTSGKIGTDLEKCSRRFGLALPPRKKCIQFQFIADLDKIQPIGSLRTPLKSGNRKDVFENCPGPTHVPGCAADNTGGGRREHVFFCMPRIQRNAGRLHPPQTAIRDHKPPKSHRYLQQSDHNNQPHPCAATVGKMHCQSYQS